MIFYEIQLHSIPNIIFSVDVSIDNYKINFHKFPKHLEFAIVLEGRIVRSNADKSLDYCNPGMFVSITEMSDFYASSVDNERQRHITVGANADYSCTKRNTETCTDTERIKKDILEKRTILIPDMVELKEQHDEIYRTIHKITQSFSSNNPHRSSYTLAQWFHLTALLTEFVLHEIEKKAYDMPPSALNYVDQAKRYVEKHYASKILIKDIAKELDISEGYLFDIFKKITGVSVLNYINQYRVNIVKQYIETYHLSLCEAALQVGIEDSAYMSRLFKKVTGVSYREYFLKTQPTHKIKELQNSFESCSS